MTSILVPVDFSKESRNALAYAISIADKLNNSIVLLHVNQKNRQLDKITPHMDSLKAQVRSKSQAIVLETLILTGDPEEIILKTAKKINPIFIVMGIDTSNILKELFWGSITTEMMEEAECPVLGIPSDANFDGIINRIGVAINYQNEDFALLEYIRKINQSFEAEIVCFHVDATHTEEFTNQMQVFMAAAKNKNQSLIFHVLEDGIYSKTVTNFVKREKIDFVVMLTHQRNFLEELFNYSKAKNLAMHTNTGVLAIPHRLIEN